MAVLSNALIAGHKNVAVTSTAVALVADSTPSAGALVVADPDNAGPVTIGGEGVAVGAGVILAAGAGLTLPPCDLATVFVNGTAGDGVGFLYSS